MTQQEYEASKSKCVADFCEEHGYIQSPDLREITSYAFDRAYALGKLQASCEQVKETITQEDVEKAALDYIRTNPFVNSRTSTTARESFVDGANFALGKQEKDAKKRPALTDKEVYALESAISELESLMDGTLDEDYHKGQKSIINALKRIIKKYEKK